MKCHVQQFKKSSALRFSDRVAVVVAARALASASEVQTNGKVAEEKIANGSHDQGLKRHLPMICGQWTPLPIKQNNWPVSTH